MSPQEKLIIYQIFPRIFTNTNANCIPNGTLEQNGSGKLSHYTAKLFESLKDMGINCLWMTGVIEHATKTDFTSFGIPLDNPNVVKGEAGSPYAIKDYYDIDPAIADNPLNRMAEFESFVDRAHKAGLKVIIDFVPNHLARVYHSDVAPKGVDDFGLKDVTSLFFRPNNNFYYITNQQFVPSFKLDREGDTPFVEFPAKATGNDCFTAFCSETDWYETVKLNYGVDPWNGSTHFDPIPDTWNKMLDVLKFWTLKGIDGFRCDMVFMVPLEFWHWLIPQIKQINPQLFFIGEIYDVAQYRPFLDWGHFDYLYDKVNLYDTLVGIEKGLVSTAQLTSCWQTVDGIGERMLNFLENHDEVRFGSKAYSDDPGNVLPSLVVSAMIGKGPMMIYYGQELGESAHDNEGFAGDNNRSTIFDYWSYDTMRRWWNNGKCDSTLMTAQEKWLRNVYKRVLNLCNSEKVLSQGYFFDLMYVNLDNPNFDPHRQYAFLRYFEGEILLIIANFDTKRVSCSVNIPNLAFEMSEMSEGMTHCFNLLDDTEINLNFQRDMPVSVAIGAKSAVVYKLDTSQRLSSSDTCGCSSKYKDNNLTKKL